MVNGLTSWLAGDTKTISFAILSAVIGFVSKGIYDIRLARRKDRLDRLNQQLKLLYGPLYSLNLSGGLAWSAFRRRVRPNGSFFNSLPPPSQKELEMWRLWMRTVFQPINAKMLLLIENNADLLIDDRLPEPLQLFCAHVAAYKVVLQQWSENDFSEHLSVIDYPTVELTAYLEKSFEDLKSEQRRLLGKQSSF
jgi:hypothetical protein